MTRSNPNDNAIASYQAALINPAAEVIDGALMAKWNRWAAPKYTQARDDASRLASPDLPQIDSAITAWAKKGPTIEIADHSSHGELAAPLRSSALAELKARLSRNA